MQPLLMFRRFSRHMWKAVHHIIHLRVPKISLRINNSPISLTPSLHKKQKRGIALIELISGLLGEKGSPDTVSCKLHMHKELVSEKHCKCTRFYNSKSRLGELFGPIQWSA